MEKIGTHNLSFQMDDVLGCAMLKCLPVFSDALIVRTRDPKVLAGCTVVLDVGGVHTPDALRFDHHQGAGARPNGVQYAAAGLVWAHYGALICRSKEVADRVDRDFIQCVDALDNGQPLVVGGEPAFEGARELSLSAAISSLNPEWDSNPTQADFDRAFSEQAVPLANVFLGAAIRRAQSAQLAYDTVSAQIADVKARVVVLNSFAPWGEAVRAKATNAAFVVFPDEAGTWMAQCVPGKEPFSKKVPLPAAWKGLRGTELDAVTGIPGGVFCHLQRFICGHTTREGAVALAQLADSIYTDYGELGVRALEAL